MKIFNWVFGSFFRTLGRFLFYLAIGVAIAFLFNGAFISNVSAAEDYSNLIYHDSSIFTWTNGTTQSVVPDNTYYKETSSYLYILRDKIYFFDNDYADETSISSGSYIMDYFIYGLVSSNNTCDTLELTMSYVDGAGSTFTSNVDCIGVEKTKMYGLDATHIYMKFTLKTPAWFITNNIKSIYSFVYPTTNNAMNYGFSIGTIQTYTTEAYNSIINTINQNNANQTIIDQNTQTNNKLDDLNNNITSEGSPNLDGLNNSAGWLPPGPVDSILNLPLSLLENITNNLSKSCQPINVNLPYVNKMLTLPCISSIYSQIEGLSTWVNLAGTIASAFILLSYFIKLYKWVDDTLTFRENNHLDNWGGL